MERNEFEGWSKNGSSSKHSAVAVAVAVAVNVQNFNKHGKKYVLTGHITSIEYEKRSSASTIAGVVQSLLYIFFIVFWDLLQSFLSSSTDKNYSKTERGYAKLTIKSLDNIEYVVTVSAELDNKKLIKEGQLVTLICKRPVGSARCFAPGVLVHHDGKIVSGFDTHGESATGDFVGRLFITGVVLYFAVPFLNSHLQTDIGTKLAKWLDINEYLALGLLTAAITVIYQAVAYLLRKNVFISESAFLSLIQHHPDSAHYLPQRHSSNNSVETVPMQMDRAAQSTPKLATSAEHHHPIESSESKIPESITSSIVSDAQRSLNAVKSFIKRYTQSKYPADDEGFKMSLNTVVIKDKNASTFINESKGTHTESHDRIIKDTDTNLWKTETVTHKSSYETREFNAIFGLVIEDADGNCSRLTIDKGLSNISHVGDVLVLASTQLGGAAPIQEFVLNVNNRKHVFDKRAIINLKPNFRPFKWLIPSVMLTYVCGYYLRHTFEFIAQISSFKEALAYVCVPYLAILVLTTLTYMNARKNWKYHLKKRGYLYNAIDAINAAHIDGIEKRK